jgi:hypothetical protein
MAMALTVSGALILKAAAYLVELELGVVPLVVW